MLGSTFFKLFPKSIKNTCVLSIYIGIWFTISIILFIITGAVKTIDETNNIINIPYVNRSDCILLNLSLFSKKATIGLNI